MIYWISALSVLIAIETVFAGTCFSLFFPPKPVALAFHFFATYQHALTPKFDVLFLRIFILVGVTSLVLLMRSFSRKSAQRFQTIKYFTLVQAAIVFCETFFLFKWAVYRNPLWINGFYAALALSAGIKIFSPEVLKFIHAMDERMKDKTPFSHLSLWLTGAGMLLIPMIIWVPDVEGAVARMFFGEHWHHIDGALMSPGWAHISGNILGVDNTTRYGMGAPILISEIARHLLGRFDYVSVVIVMMLVSVLYYWIWFYALRLFLKDTTWALIAIFLGIRLQFFNIETFPFIFTYPQVTPIRFFFDSMFFIFLILHAQDGGKLWLYLLSAVCGFSVFYIPGEGAFALATFYVFLLLREIFVAMEPGSPLRRLNKTETVLLIVLPWLVLLSSLWLAAGNHVFTRLFWKNQFEFISFYQAGNQVSLMLNNLTAPFVDRAAIAFLLPVAYLFALVVLLGRLMQRSLKIDGLILACAFIFLLVSYQYHALLSNNMPSYLRNGVIIAMCAVFILKEMTARLGKYRQRLCKLGSAILVLVMTVTTHQFLLHPNIFNLSRNPMTHPVVSQVPEGRKSYFSHLFISYPDAFKLPVNGLGQKDELLVTENDFTDDQQLKDLYRQETDYSKDAALIQSLTAKDQEVPVISSFENLILMKSQRRPFFYLYFMVNSQPRRMRKFPVTMLYTKDNLQRELDRIDQFKPPYIFVERTYFVSPIPQAYLYDNEDLVDLLSYVFNHYQPYKAGEFLVALKRR